MSFKSFSFMLACLLSLLLLLGCRQNTSQAELVDEGSGGTTVTSPEGGGGAAPAHCDGECYKLQAPFLRFSLWSIDTPDAVRPCPPWAAQGEDFHADLQVEPHACPECSCSPPACALPETITASSSKCNEPGGIATNYSPLPGWEGTCSAADAIAAGASCEGEPCVASLTVSASVVEPCQPKTGEAPPRPKESWGKTARECVLGDLGGEGCDGSRLCTPYPPEGFTVCLFVSGAGPGLACPEPFTRQEVVFAGTDDQRGCEPCQCGEAMDAECEALVSVFKEGQCSSLLGSYTLAKDEPGCFDLPSGSPLGSKSAVLVADKPGTCAPNGGGTTGALLPSWPVTLCCLPPPAEAG